MTTPQPAVNRDALDTTWALAALAGLMPAEDGLPEVGEPEVLAWVAGATTADPQEYHRRVRIAGRAGVTMTRLAHVTGLSPEQIHEITGR